MPCELFLEVPSRNLMLSCFDGDICARGQHNFRLNPEEEERLRALL